MQINREEKNTRDKDEHKKMLIFEAVHLSFVIKYWTVQDLNSNHEKRINNDGLEI